MTVSGGVGQPLRSAWPLNIVFLDAFPDQYLENLYLDNWHIDNLYLDQSREFPTTAHQGGGEVREATVWGFQVIVVIINITIILINIIVIIAITYVCLTIITQFNNTTILSQWRKSSTRCGLHVAEAKANVAGRSDFLFLLSVTLEIHFEIKDIADQVISSVSAGGNATWLTPTQPRCLRSGMSVGPMFWCKPVTIKSSLPS